MVAKQGRHRLFRDPCDARSGIAFTDQIRNRKGVDYIADGRETQDADGARLSGTAAGFLQRANGWIVLFLPRGR